MDENLTFREEGDVVVIDVHGKLTSGESSRALREMLRELLDAGYRNLLLNMAGAADLDSSGLGELAAGFATVSSAGGTLKLLKPGKRTQHLFGVIRMDSVFETFQDENTAILSFYLAPGFLVEDILHSSSPGVRSR
jgi:anti-sigma B factor antagonist